MAIALRPQICDVTSPDVYTYLSEVSAGHFRENDVEWVLVVVRDESIVKYAQRLVAEQTENLLVVTDDAWIGLQQSWRWAQMRMKVKLGIYSEYKHVLADISW